jgi:protein SCO1/2
MLVSHRDIPGFMPAMVMPFRAADPGELAGLRPGSRVRFDLAVRRHSSIAAHIRPSALAPDVPVRAPPEKLSVGSPVPDVVLMDETGRAARFSDFRGKVIVTDFIYTRCPLPEVCPRLSANFARLQRRFAAQLGSNLMLFSVTIDPQYDTPAVLSRYAKIWKANPAGWHFLTGDAAQVLTLSSAFGMVYWSEEGSLTHTSETAIIARDGRLAALVDGAAYAVSQLGDLIAVQLEEGR